MIFWIADDGVGQIGKLIWIPLNVLTIDFLDVQYLLESKCKPEVNGNVEESVEEFLMIH